MWRATIKGVFARKVRLLLTALAVVLGVTFVSGTYVLTDTLHASLGEIFQQYASGSDLVVAARRQVGDRATSRQRIPSDLAREVRRVDGVAAATPFLIGDAKFIERDHRTAIQPLGAATLGISWAGGRSVGPARILDGRRPRRDGEVAMDAGTARRYGFHVGDEVRVLLTGAAEPFRITGLLALGNREDLGFATVAAFDPATAAARVPRRRAGGLHLRAGRARRITRSGPAGDRLGGRPRARRAALERLRRGSPTAGRRLPHADQRPPARLRRDRAARRRLHHLQHLHDPGGPADPRAGSSACDGRVRWAGRRIRPDRGVDHGPRRVRRRLRARRGAGEAAALAPARCRGAGARPTAGGAAAHDRGLCRGGRRGHPARSDRAGDPRRADAAHRGHRRSPHDQPAPLRRLAASSPAPSSPASGSPSAPTGSAVRCRWSSRSR